MTIVTLLVAAGIALVSFGTSLPLNYAAGWPSLATVPLSFASKMIYGFGLELSKDDGRTKNGANLASVLSIMEMCWGDVGLLLSMPRQGLGNSAIASVATDDQLSRYEGKWAAMAITEPDAGSDSAAIRTTARSARRKR